MSLPTFGWVQIRDEPTARAWMSDGATLLTIDYFRSPPDVPGLESEQLERYFGTHQHDDSQRLVIELALDRAHAVPLIRVITREHLPERDRFVFQVALIAPFATCSWVVKVVQVEGDVTGLRESLAFDKYARTHPDRVDTGPPFDGFDPYAREWDDKVPDELDPLSAVRRHAANVESALAFGPEALAEPPFAPNP